MTEPRRPIRPVSRKAQIIGGAIALAVLAGVVWLAWSLMHAPKGEGGGAGGPGGGFGGGFCAPSAAHEGPGFGLPGEVQFYTSVIRVR